MEKSKKPIMISLKPSKVHSEEVLTNISCFINTAMKKQISWSSLALILDEMASTLDISKQVIKVLLDTLQSVIENEAIDKGGNAKVNSNETQKNIVSEEMTDEEVEVKEEDDEVKEEDDDEVAENDDFFDDSLPEIENDEMIKNDDDIEEVDEEWPFGSEAEFKHESEEELKKELKSMEPLTERENLDFEQVPAKEVDDKLPMAEEVKKEVDNSLPDTDLDYTVITQFKQYERGPKKGTGRWTINILAGPYTYGMKKINDSQHALFNCIKCRNKHGMCETLIH